MIIMIHGTCVEATSSIEIARGERTFVCGPDCPPVATDRFERAAYRLVERLRATLDALEGAPPAPPEPAGDPLTRTRSGTVTEVAYVDVSDPRRGVVWVDREKADRLSGRTWRPLRVAPGGDS